MRSNRARASSPSRLFAAGLMAGALAATATACGSSTPAAAPAASHHAASHSGSMTESAATVGTDCAMIPAAGMGSMHGMAMAPVVTAASHNPLITTLAAEVKKAGLAGTLNSAKTITVFAPDNHAFKKLSAQDMSMMRNTAEHAKILKYHVVYGHIKPTELDGGTAVTTL